MRTTATVLLAAVACPGAARAAGFYSTDAGVRAYGRGAAFTAGVDDVSAQYWNPAALTRVRREVDVQLTGVHQAVTFEGAGQGGEIGPDLAPGGPFMVIASVRA